ncbi:retrovirus-related pol polyprotein from transposon TNT 1-94 [Tanacetum coccineum]
MTGNLKLLSNFVEQFLGTVKFGNDQITPILGYGDLVQGNVTIKRVYYVEGLNHNLFSVGQFCDADLEVAFRKSTCYVCDLKENNLLIGSCGSDLYSINLQDTNSPNPICLMAKATSSQAWKAKRKSFHTKTTPSSKRWLQLLHMDLCGPMRVESINGNKYVLVIVDDYSRYTWTHFLRSKDETPEVLINFLKLVQRGLHAQVRTTQTDKGMKFLNKTLHAYFAQEGIEHQTSTARTPEQNSVVERRNRTLVEAARTMLSAAKVPLLIWAEQFPQHVLRKNVHLGAEILYRNSDSPIPTCVGTSMATKPLDAHLSGSPIDQTKYHSMVEALMYLIASRPDIVHATCYCASYQARPTKKHLREAKRIFRYLKNTINIRLWYPKDTGFELTAFSDSDHAGCLNSRKSTSGGIQFLGGDKLVLWLRTQITNYGFHFDKIPMYCDSKVEEGIVQLFFVGTQYQLADLFTKALPEDRFKLLSDESRVVCFEDAQDRTTVLQPHSSEVGFIIPLAHPHSFQKSINSRQDS